MFASKERNSSAVGRPPMCGRCRNHGNLVPQKGHVKVCPFFTCCCVKCDLVTKRSRIMAVERRLKRQSARVDAAARPGLATGNASDHSVTPGADAPENSAIKTPDGRVEDVNGKTYAELHAVTSFRDISPREDLGLNGCSPTVFHERPSAVDQFEGTRDMLRSAGQRIRAQDGLLGMTAPPYGEFGGRDLYRGEFMAMPSTMGLPLQLVPHFPRYLPYPAMLVNMPPMPPIPYHGLPVLPHFQPFPLPGQAEAFVIAPGGRRTVSLPHLNLYQLAPWLQDWISSRGAGYSNSEGFTANLSKLD